jgi:17beta-estradiol 17-dehydrogenase / very-long-chain 3-oxoacyl-CoA reductase
MTSIPPIPIPISENLKIPTVFKNMFGYSNSHIEPCHNDITNKVNMGPSYGKDLFHKSKDIFYKSKPYITYFLVILAILILLKILIYRVLPFIYQYGIMSEQDLLHRYGQGSWAVITGASSGIGRRFAYELAERGFNLLLIGSVNIYQVSEDIKIIYPSLKVTVLISDFSESFKDSFFDNIENEISKLGTDWSILINNVGYRTGWINYEDMPFEEIKKTISVGTLVQARLLQLSLGSFKERSNNNKRSSIVNITAQCTLNNDLFLTDNSISIPHMSCYEATNAFGYFHAKCIYEEINDTFPLIDFLVITPGAVITKRTSLSLEHIPSPFTADVKTYVKNVIKLMGNLNGPQHAYWGHSFGTGLANIFPLLNKRKIEKDTGYAFSREFEEKYAIRQKMENLKLISKEDRIAE